MRILYDGWKEPFNVCGKKDYQGDMMRVIFAACLTILLVAIPFAAAEKMKIAIMDFRPRDLPRADAVRITNLIRIEMTNAGYFTVLDRSIIINVMKEQEINMTGCTDVECAARVGKLLGVRKILTGDIIRVGETVTVVCRVIDVARVNIDSIEKEQTRAKEDIFNVVGRLCDKLSLVIAGSVLKIKGNP